MGRVFFYCEFDVSVIRVRGIQELVWFFIMPHFKSFHRYGEFYLLQDLLLQKITTSPVGRFSIVVFGKQNMKRQFGVL